MIITEKYSRRVEIENNTIKQTKRERKKRKKEETKKRRRRRRAILTIHSYDII
jgi:hypothetical protein